jgi:hypothetical protein
MKVAQKLLGAPTIGGGSARAEDVVEEVKGGKKAPSWPKIKKQHRKQAVLRTFLLKNHRKCSFLLKSTILYILLRLFLRNTLILTFLWNYTCSKFQKSYTPSAIRFWVNILFLPR